MSQQDIRKPQETGGETLSLRSDPLQIARLIEAESGGRLPPVHLWHPPFCGDIDMEIRRNGQWFYLGTPINRAPLVKLFSSVLRRDEDDAYYLVTPVEKVRIRVEDAPFLITTLEVLERDGARFLQFTTQTGDVVVAGAEHPIWLEYRDGEPQPYVHVRDRLHALIGRNVYYELVWLGESGPAPSGDDGAGATGEDGRGAGGREALLVESAGERFVIGHF